MDIWIVMVLVVAAVLAVPASIWYTIQIIQWFQTRHKDSKGEVAIRVTTWRLLCRNSQLIATVIVISLVIYVVLVIILGRFVLDSPDGELSEITAYLLMAPFVLLMVIGVMFRAARRL